MKSLLRTGCVLAMALAATASAQPARYAEVVLPALTPTDLAALAADGIHFNHARPGKSADGSRTLTAVLRADEAARLVARLPGAAVTVPDLAAAYRARPAPDAARLDALRRSAGVDGFGYGSMGGYYTLAEVEAKLDEMRADYPDLVTEKASIGQSIEGRDIWAVKISANADADEGEPEALYTALHHAREPQGMATVVYFMFYLLERYGEDPEVTYLLDNRELYFVPVLNPDGYVYNETTDPAGGGYWRKNRRDHGGGVYGVDLNRNYDYLWGLNDIGSSPNPGSDTYRGAGPFSEPESQAISELVNAHEFRVALNYHTYSDLLLYPWGYDTATYTEDDELFRALSVQMTRDNGYTYGTGPDILYATNGNSDDWMYGEQWLKPKILSFTPEVGASFWPGQDQIFPLAEENVRQNLVTAWAAGAFVSVRAASWEEAAPGNGFVDPGEDAAVTLTLDNLGARAAEGVQLRLRAATPDVSVLAGGDTAPFAIEPESAFSTPPLQVHIGPDVTPGASVRLIAEVLLAERVVAEVELPPFTVGTPVAFFSDDASDLSAWAPVGGWGLTDGYPYSPPTAFSDSPEGDYWDNAHASLTLLEPLDLSAETAPWLTFRARWDIESNWDFAQVLASTDGANWQPLAGQHTSEGSGQGVQGSGQPGYEGLQLDWVHERVSLAEYAGQPEVHVRFTLRADGGVTGDGLDVDDVEVVRYTDGGTVAEEPGASGWAFGLRAVFPNPSAGLTTIRYSLREAGPVDLGVYDVLGRRVATLARGEAPAGPHAAAWDGRSAEGPVPAGVYLVRLLAGGERATRPVAVLR